LNLRVFTVAEHACSKGKREGNYTSDLREEEGRQEKNPSKSSGMTQRGEKKRR